MIFPYKSQLRYAWNTILFPVNAEEVVATSRDWNRRQRLLAWIALTAASLIVLLPNLSYPLIEPDETRYAQIAIEMNQSRDWITPSLDGIAYLDKPPLMYWLTATSFSLLGTNETAARLPSMLSAFLTIVIVFSLGSRIVGGRAAWLSAASLLLCGGFVLAGRFLILDALLAMFTTLCMLTGYIAVRGQRHRWAWWMVSGIACALGVLTKGPIALVLCAPPLVVSGWLRADQTRTRVLHWAAFLLPMLLVCLPWYVAVGIFNPQFMDHFFLEHNFKRFTEGSNRREPFWFYLPVVFVGMFPSSLLLPSVGVFVVSTAERKRELRSKDLGFLFCGATWMLIFFSAASCKLPTYILPAIPLICLILGVMLDQTVMRPERANRITNYLRPFPQRATLIILGTWIGVFAADAWIGRTVSLMAFASATVCLATGITTLRMWNREIAFSWRGWAATMIVAVGLLSFAAARFMPTVSTARSLYVRTLRLTEEHPQSPVVFFGEKPHAITLQIPHRPIVYFAPTMHEEFKAFLSLHDRTIVITGDETIADTRVATAPTHQFTEQENHEHLYLAERIEHATPHIASVADGASH
ncbi:ArnT family glycosyltransferase [Aporhodopirellula aestuarii]|uniref:Glycosyltransferase family 39 protein n=1 Tax=Aporhodopirellula aestuarii TaxID=2950107 RepID=A0ABT0U712_9BACT|nr:glycosyltransferase family 39 protein [Aporhodopirellula aestuarii]MCM2372576.1 glycosyltransferase family 39 protein [Aporhodopirellula aestuarii]